MPQRDIDVLVPGARTMQAHREEGRGVRMSRDSFTAADIIASRCGTTTSLALQSAAGRAWLVDHVVVEGLDFVVSVVVSSDAALIQEMREDGLSVLEQ